MNDNLAEKLNNKINENQQFTVSELLTCFPLISHTLLYEIVAERLHYHEIWQDGCPQCEWMSKKEQHVTSSLTTTKHRNSWITV
jgi:hypothetical protein